MPKFCERADSHAHATRLRHQVACQGDGLQALPSYAQRQKTLLCQGGIKDGGPIIGPDHPVMLEMFERPITGALGFEYCR
jgi:hypothetical protein